MREIKFRALQARPLPGKQHFIYGFITEPNGPGKGIAMMDVGRGERWQVLMETVGQYTGLKDRNNVEVYEGDLLWDDDEYAKVEYIGGGFWAHFDGVLSDLEETIWGGAIVQGNIHENPDRVKF